MYSDSFHYLLFPSFRIQADFKILRSRLLEILLSLKDRGTKLECNEDAVLSPKTQKSLAVLREYLPMESASGPEENLMDMMKEGPMHDPRFPLLKEEFLESLRKKLQEDEKMMVHLSRPAKRARSQSVSKPEHEKLVTLQALLVESLQIPIDKLILRWLKTAVQFVGMVPRDVFTFTTKGPEEGAFS